ncbi:MAG: ATP synthase subunit C [Candidatus Nezhaarchaeales archaeon]
MTRRVEIEINIKPVTWNSAIGVCAMKKLLTMSLMLALLGLAIAAMGAISAYAAVTGEGGQEAEFAGIGLSKLGAGMAIGFAALGAGIGLGTASAAAIGVIAEKPELFGRTIIYIVFVEAVAIYGLVIALLLWMA